MASARVAVDASDGSTLPHEPTGYILSYGVSYKGVSNGEALAELPACPPSATAAHDAFVSKCGFSSTFSPTVNEDVTKSRMVEDVRRAATTVASHDVVVLFFCGYGKRMDDTACLYDSAGCVVSVHKLQSVFAETAVERGVCDASFVVILDCCYPAVSLCRSAAAGCHAWLAVTRGWLSRAAGVITWSSVRFLVLILVCGDNVVCGCRGLIRVMIEMSSTHALVLLTSTPGLLDSWRAPVRCGGGRGSSV